MIKIPKQNVQVLQKYCSHLDIIIRSSLWNFLQHVWPPLLVWNLRSPMVKMPHLVNFLIRCLFVGVYHLSFHWTMPAVVQSWTSVTFWPPDTVFWSSASLRSSLVSITFLKMKTLNKKLQLKELSSTNSIRGTFLCLVKNRYHRFHNFYLLIIKILFKNINIIIFAK